MPVRAATTAAISDLADLQRAGRVDLLLQPGGALVVLVRDAFSSSGRRSRAAGQAQLRRGLVDQVDRLVGQAVLGDVAVAQPRRGVQRRVVDHDAVVRLVGAAQAAQDLDRVLDGRLLDRHRREAAGERGVALDLAVLGQRGGADHAQLAAREQRLEDVGGVHRALGVPAPSTVCSSSMNRTILPSARRPRRAPPSGASRTGRGTGRRRSCRTGRARRCGCRAASRGRRCGGCAGPGPRRWRSCRRRPRRSARRCSCAGGRGSRPSARSRRCGRSRGRCGRSAASAVRSRPNSSSADSRFGGLRLLTSSAHVSHSTAVRRSAPAAKTIRTVPGRSPQAWQGGVSKISVTMTEISDWLHTQCDERTVDSRA